MIQEKESLVNYEWRLMTMEKRMESIEQKTWALLLLMIANLGGIIGILLGILLR